MKISSFLSEAALPPTARSWLAAVAVAGVLALWLNGQWLPLRSVPVTPAGDLAKHVAMALNFFDAVEDGQWLPRLQLNPPAMPDIPTFQYYGFMTGLSAYPFLVAGLTGIQAIAASVVTMHFLGYLALYACCRTLEMKHPAGLVAMILYAVEPYPLSTIYGRVAIPESHAQCLLLFGAWGSALLWQGRHRRGFIVIALTVAALAVTHNVFLLYGTGFFAILALVGASTFRGILIASAAMGTGLLLAGFQWMPALISTQNLDINFLKDNPARFAMFTDWGGLAGILRPLSPSPNYFFTYSWWTLPGLLVLFALGMSQRPARALAIAGLLFFVLSLGIIDVWSLLPKFTWALQFPYRLISFVALVACLGAGYATDRWLNTVGMFTLGLLATVRSLTVLYAPAPDQIIPMSDAQIARDFALQDYAITSRNEIAAAKIVASDGWLMAGHLLTSRENLPSKVELLASSVFPDRSIEIWLEKVSSPGSPISRRVRVAPGSAQAVILEAEIPAREIRIVASDYLVPAEYDHNPQGDKRRLSLRLSFLAVDGHPVFNTTVNARLVSHSGYTRTFLLPSLPPGLSRLPGDLVTLPTAYSSFLRITQDGISLPTEPSPNGLVALHPVSSSTLRSSYRLPAAALLTPLVGIAVLLFGAFSLKNHTGNSSLRPREQT